MEILLLDDDSHSLSYSLKAILSLRPGTIVHTASTVEEAMLILREKSVTAAFLDVELTVSSGFALSSFMKNEHPDVAVVFLTGHVDLALESYDYEPFDFLTKPVDIMRMEKTLRRLEEREKKGTGRRRITIETRTGLAVLDTAEITVIEKKGNLCSIRTAGGEECRVTYTLDRLEQMLSSDGFFRTHQSFLVPLSRIARLNGGEFGSGYEATLSDGTRVPVSRSRYPRLREAILRSTIRLT